MGDLSRNFSRSEFACQGGDACCGGSSPVSRDLIEALQELRDMVGKPLVITSGFRCRKHNREIGGATESQHCLGTAADIQCPGLPPEVLAESAATVERFRQGGIGVYRRWVHVDVRTNGPARWEG